MSLLHAWSGAARDFSDVRNSASGSGGSIQTSIVHGCATAFRITAPSVTQYVQLNSFNVNGGDFNPTDAGDNLTFGGYLYVGSAPAAAKTIADLSNNLGAFAGTINATMRLRLGTDLKLYISYFQSSTTETTSANRSAALTPGGFYRIEGQIRNRTVNGSGELEIRLDGVAWDNISGLNFSGRTITGFKVGMAADASGDIVWADCLWTNDANWLGEYEVNFVTPDGAGNYAQMTEGTGTTFAEVDDYATGATDDDTSYIGSTGSLQSHSFTFTQPNTYASIIGLQGLHRTSTSSAGTVVEALLRVNGTDYTRTIGSNAGYMIRQHVYPTNPDTAVAWVNGDLATLEFGAHVGSGAVTRKVSALGLYIVGVPSSPPEATVAASLPSLTGAAVAYTFDFGGPAAATLPALTGAAQAETFAAQSGATLPALTAALLAEKKSEGAARPRLPALTASITVEIDPITAEAAATLPSLVAAVVASVPHQGAADVRLPSLTSAGLASIPNSGGVRPQGGVGTFRPYPGSSSVGRFRPQQPGTGRFHRPQQGQGR